MAKTKNRVSGTREWAQTTVNCVTGCKHDCLYCYARYNAVDRFKRVRPNDWTDMVVRENDVRKGRPKKKGVTMFPSTHDITPEVMEPCLTVLGKLLDSGNEVLLVSKPHTSVIKEIVKRFGHTAKTDQLRFRFTIGSPRNHILKFWEPGAPLIGERVQSLKIAYEAGFQTSISAEPLLDPDCVKQLWDMLIPYVTWEFWIGKMNNIESRVKITDEVRKYLDSIYKGQTDEYVMGVYRMLKDEPLVRWKDSYKEVIERCE